MTRVKWPRVREFALIRFAEAVLAFLLFYSAVIVFMVLFAGCSVLRKSPRYGTCDLPEVQPASMQLFACGTTSVQGDVTCLYFGDVDGQRCALMLTNRSCGEWKSEVHCASPQQEQEQEAHPEQTL